MTRASTQRSSEAGFTLVELMVAVFLLLVGVLGVLSLLSGANQATWRTKARDAGTNLAREVIEASRAIPYPEMIPADFERLVRSQPGLASTGPSWTVMRRNIAFTITASVCSVDDGTVEGDGFGRHAGGWFCADSTQEDDKDTNPDDYKRVTVDVTWKDGGETRKVRQQAVINNPGSAFAPALVSLAPSLGGNGVQITTDPETGPQKVTFTAKTHIRAEELKWFLDNVQMSPAPQRVTDTEWRFEWSIPAGVRDGTYLVRAEAYDKFGQAGTSRTATMGLNRAVPALPTGFVGGRNPLWGVNDAPDGTTFVEFEWFSSNDGDILGYEVRRVANDDVGPSPTDPVACRTEAKDPSLTSCYDVDAPDGPAHYYVVALAPARTGAGVESSDLTKIENLLLVGDNDRPNPPGPVSSEPPPEGGGGVTLTWEPANDPDGAIRYYRIYRDGQLLERRVGHTGAADEYAWHDRDGVPGKHRYWVTAVDDRLAESTFAPTDGIVP